MEGGTPAHDLTHLRVSDDDRHRVAEILRRAAGDGRLDLTELDERLDAAFRAKTYAELEPITRDLPEHPGRLLPAAVAAKPGAVIRPDDGSDHEHHLALLGGFDRKGPWRVPAHMTVTAVLGGVDLDYREAVFAAPECVLTVTAVLGGANIIVGPDVHVTASGIGILGGVSSPSRRQQPPAGAPVLKIRGLSVLGGVSVKRKAPKQLG